MSAARVLGVAFATMVFACSGDSHRSRGPSEESEARKVALPSLSAADVTRILDQVSGSRGMVVHRDVKIERLDPAAFREEVSRRVEADETSTEVDAEAESALNRREAAFLAGFDFLPPPSKREGIATTEELLTEQVAAFYDKREDKIYVPVSSPQSEEDALIQRAIVAHEVQHALQAQNFPPETRRRHAPRPEGEVESTDEALAHLALIEGDAMVAMGAYVGAELGAPVGRTLRRIRETTENVPREALAHEQHGSALQRSIDLSRARLSFPYEEGMFFVSDVYRAGGFELVDQMFSKIPTTTEQILHPQKYLAGEGARPIRSLEVPPGLSLVGSDVMGELQMGVLLRRCTDAARAGVAAEGWGGDRFFLLASKGRSLGVAWVTTWDSEADAREFEQVMVAAKSCFGENAIDDHRISSSVVVRRRGDTVALVRGLDSQVAERILKKLVDLPGPASKPMAVSDAVIPPRVSLPEPRKGRMDGDVYRSEWLGLVGRVPKGLRIHTDNERLELFIDRPDELVAGALSFSTRITSDEQNERTFREVRDAFERALDKRGLTLAKVGSSAPKTALGNGIDRTWKVRGTPIRIRATLVPICAGTGAILFIRGYSDDHAEQVLEGWMSSFRFGKGRNIPACDFLDPK